MSTRGSLGPPDLDRPTPDQDARQWVVQRLGLASCLIWSILTVLLFIAVIRPAGFSPWEMVAASSLTVIPAAAPWLLYRSLLARRRMALGLPPVPSRPEQP